MALARANLPSAPIECKAAWIGQELQAHPDEWTYHVTESDIGELLAAVATAKDRGLPLERINMASFSLPTFGPKLKAFANEIYNGQGFVLLRGMPTDGVPMDDIRTMYFGISVYLGLPVAQDSNNSLLGSVRHEGTYNRTTRGYKSNVALGYHNDSAAVVGLYCIKTAKSGGVSKIMSAVQVHNTIMKERPDILEILYNDPFYYQWKEGGLPGGREAWWSRTFSWFENRLSVRWVEIKLLDTQRDVESVPKWTAAQAEAYDFLNSITQRPELCLDMDFAPGDVQYLNNNAIFHSRTEFEDFEDLAERRHLLRVWLNRYNEPATAPDFTDRYDQLGDTAANPRRRLFPIETYDTW